MRVFAHCFPGKVRSDVLYPVMLRMLTLLHAKISPKEQQQQQQQQQQQKQQQQQQQQQQHTPYAHKTLTLRLDTGG